MKVIKTNVNLYKCFLEIYEAKNYSAAAEKLGLTQPTMSYNIRELEKQLKVRLFNTNSRGVEPTKYADELYPMIRSAFINLLQAEDSILEFNKDSAGVVNLGVSLYYTPQITSEFISRYSKIYKNVSFDIEMLDIESGNKALASHETDIFVFSFTNETVYDKKTYTVLKLFELENNFFASHEFIKQNKLTDTITKEQLLSLPILLVKKPYPIRNELERIGICEPILETNSTQMLIDLAKKNMGIIFGPDKYMDAELKKINVQGIKPIKCFVAVKYNNALANKAAIAIIAEVRRLFPRPSIS